MSEHKVKRLHAGDQVIISAPMYDDLLRGIWTGAVGFTNGEWALLIQRDGFLAWWSARYVLPADDADA